MPLVETQAIVLRTYKLAEADKIVVCLTERAGVVRGVAHGARRLKSRFGAALEPFSLIALVFHEKEGRELVTLKQAEILRSYFSLAQDYERFTALEQMSDLVLSFAPPHEPNEKIFRLLKACAEAQATRPEQTAAIALYFEIWLLKLAGFLPDWSACAQCGRRFEREERARMDGGSLLRCRACAPEAASHFSSEARSLLRASQRLGPLEFARAQEEEAEGGGAQTNTAQAEVLKLTRSLIARTLEREARASGTLKGGREGERRA